MALAFSTMAALRFGTGFRPGQAPPESIEEMLGELDAARREKLSFPDGGVLAAKDRIAESTVQLALLKQAGKRADPETKRLNRVRFNIELVNLLTVEEHARFIQTVLSPYGFNERLAGFWLNHFSVNARKEYFMRLIVPLYEAEAIRPHIAGRFADLAKAAVLHPAMLIYLDQVKSIGPNSPQGRKRGKGLNENLARELLELHTLGAGSGYTQADVRNAAFVLTGMTVDRKTYQARYSARIAEPGAKVVCGRSYGGRVRSQSDVEALVEDLAAAPETRNHICRKIAAHFIADTPPREVVEAMAVAWKRTDGELAAVYAAMLRRPASWAEEGQKAKPPFDYIVSGLRALSIGADDMRHRGLRPDAPAQAAGTAEGAMPQMTGGAEPMGLDPAALRLRHNPLTVPAVQRLGQPVWQPPSPAGFDDVFSTWIAGGPLAGRIAWARLAAARLGGDRDPRAFLHETLRDAARQDTIDTVMLAPTRQMGIALVLASPEFNRR
jgi:uncharacterized protein (DUF1800 family)